MGGRQAASPHRRPDIALVPVVAVLGAVVPYGQVTSMGVTVVPARQLPGLLCSLPPTLTPERAREEITPRRRLEIIRRLATSSYGRWPVRTPESVVRSAI